MSFASTTTLCTFFIKGKCTKGMDCRFSHASIATAPSVSVPCSFFLAGKCTKGSGCRFAHEPLDSEPLASGSPASGSPAFVPPPETEIETETDNLTPDDWLNIAAFWADQDEDDEEDEENLDELDNVLSSIEQWPEKLEEPNEC